jgi:hypothetical protein
MLLKGVQFGTLYKLQGRTISDGCNSCIVPNIGVEEERMPIVSGVYRREGPLTTTW